LAISRSWGRICSLSVSLTGFHLLLLQAFAIAVYILGAFPTSSLP
jgi:hypothetical protein